MSVNSDPASAGLPGNILFSVEDTGMGVPEDKQNLLFQPFNQIDSSITRKHGGSGLGLAISRKLVNHMGGEFKLISAPNKGSCFQFILYLEPQALQPEGERAKPLEGKKIGLGAMSMLQKKVLTHLLQRNGMEIIDQHLSNVEMLLWDYGNKEAIPPILIEQLKLYT